MKILLKVIIMFIINLILFGFLCPYLISSKSNELVILGFMLLFGFIFVAIPLVFKEEIKDMMNHFFKGD